MMILNSPVCKDNDESLYDCVACFGEYNPESDMCKSNCGISVRCAIEHDQQTKDEIMQDLFDAEMYQHIVQ